MDYLLYAMPAMMAPMRQEPMTVGLLKKGQKNNIQTYVKMSHLVQNTYEFNSQQIWNQFSSKMKQNPQQYFNFGFTYTDFKQFLLKLMYMRAERRFFQKSFAEKIQSNYPNGMDGDQ